MKERHHKKSSVISLIIAAAVAVVVITAAFCLPLIFGALSSVSDIYKKLDSNGFSYSVNKKGESFLYYESDSASVKSAEAIEKIDFNKMTTEEKDDVVLPKLEAAGEIFTFYKGKAKEIFEEISYVMENSPEHAEQLQYDKYVFLYIENRSYDYLFKVDKYSGSNVVGKILPSGTKHTSGKYAI